MSESPFGEMTSQMKGVRQEVSVPLQPCSFLSHRAGPPSLLAPSGMLGERVIKPEGTVRAEGDTDFL